MGVIKSFVEHFTDHFTNTSSDVYQSFEDEPFYFRIVGFFN